VPTKKRLDCKENIKKKRKEKGGEREKTIHTLNTTKIHTSSDASLQHAESERGPLAEPEKIEDSADSLLMKGCSHTTCRVERGVASTESTRSTTITTSQLSFSRFFLRCCVFETCVTESEETRRVFEIPAAAEGEQSKPCYNMRKLI